MVVTLSQPLLGSVQHCPRHVAGFKGAVSRQRERKTEEKKSKPEKGKEGKKWEKTCPKINSWLWPGAVCSAQTLRVMLLSAPTNCIKGPIVIGVSII